MLVRRHFRSDPEFPVDGRGRNNRPLQVDVLGVGEQHPLAARAMFLLAGGEQVVLQRLAQRSQLPRHAPFGLSCHRALDFILLVAESFKQLLRNLGEAGLVAIGRSRCGMGVCDEYPGVLGGRGSRKGW